MHTAELVV